jgi:hypothetical protein
MKFLLILLYENRFFSVPIAYFQLPNPKAFPSLMICPSKLLGKDFQISLRDGLANSFIVVTISKTCDKYDVVLVSASSRQITSNKSYIHFSSLKITPIRCKCA